MWSKLNCADYKFIDGYLLAKFRLIDAKKFQSLERQSIVYKRYKSFNNYTLVEIFLNSIQE